MGAGAHGEGGPVPLPEPGRWSLERSLLDRRTGQRGSVHGVLLITAAPAPDAAGQRWSERGTMRWDGRDLPVYRELRVAVRDGRWWVLFDDGRPFHPWTPGVDVVHPCAADVYTGRVDLDGGVLRTRWDVVGPAKDQLLVTEFHHLGGRRPSPFP